jgi:translocator protein
VKDTMRNATGLVGQPAGVSKPRFRRRHAVAIFVAANLLSILPAGVTGDGAFYTSFELPSVAPPAWLFAPTWLFLNVTSLLALSRVANAPQLTRGHRLFFVFEGTGWLLFALFNTLYFGLGSPILGAVDTAAGLAVGIASLVCGLTLDRRAAWLILPRVLWLVLATYVSVYVALNNPDPLFGVGW